MHTAKKTSDLATTSLSCGPSMARYALMRAARDVSFWLSPSLMSLSLLISSSFCPCSLVAFPYSFSSATMMAA